MKPGSDLHREGRELSCFKVVALSVFVAAAVCISAGAGAKNASAAGNYLADDFGSHSIKSWEEGSTHEPWYVDYDGYGSVGVEANNAGNKYHYQRPMVSTSPEETHASMVHSTKSFDGVDMTMRQKTAKRLRRGSQPNPWEVAWVVWGYRDDAHFYYFIFKPNGIELGKVHPGYPGGQRYLYTATSPRMTIGKWDTIRVRQVGAEINVWVDGDRVVRGFVDSPGQAGDRPYTTGRIGMYNEDAHVRFDNVTAVSTNN